MLVTGGPEDGTHILLSGRTIIGRGLEADIKVDDPTVSLAHALIWTDHRTAWIQDLATCNGTLVNDERLGNTARQLHSFDRITLGGLQTIHWVFMQSMDTVEMRRMALE